MRWLTNTFDPSKPDAELYICGLSGETWEQAIERERHYLSDKIIADPKATEYYTVEQLEEIGMVGVYAKS